MEPKLIAYLIISGIILVCIVVAKLLPNKWNYDGKRLFMVICYATIVLFGGIAWDNYMEKKVLGEKAFFSDKERATSFHSDGKTAGPLVIKTDSTRSMLRDSIVGDYYYAQVVVDTLDGRIILGKDQFYTWITMEEHNGTVIIDFDLDDYSGHKFLLYHDHKVVLDTIYPTNKHESRVITFHTNNIIETYTFTTISTKYRSEYFHCDGTSLTPIEKYYAEHDVLRVWLVLLASLVIGVIVEWQIHKDS